jgi:hypothetical protein
MPVMYKIRQKTNTNKRRLVTHALQMVRTASGLTSAFMIDKFVEESG